jgi:hypothetical protein
MRSENAMPRRSHNARAPPPDRQRQRRIQDRRRLAPLRSHSRSKRRQLLRKTEFLERELRSDPGVGRDDAARLADQEAVAQKASVKARSMSGSQCWVMCFW